MTVTSDLRTNPEDLTRQVHETIRPIDVHYAYWPSSLFDAITKDISVINKIQCQESAPDVSRNTDCVDEKHNCATSHLCHIWP